MSRRRASTALALLLAAGCGGGAVVHLRGTTMGTTYSIKLVPPAAGVGGLDAALTSYLAWFNRCFSTWDDGSQICRFNAHASTEPFALDDEFRADFLAVLRLALEVAEATDGAFDPTVLPLVDALGFGRDLEMAADSELVAAARAAIGWRKVRVLGDGRVAKDDPAVRLTFSAIAKGAGVDGVAALLRRHGVDSYMVEIGGEVVAAGRKPDGSRWMIGIEEPRPPGEPTAIHTAMELDGALATSGDYRNFRLVGERFVHHILDPRTGDNARSPWASVAVRAEACALADALATAFMVLGPEAAAPVVERYAGRGVGALFLAPDGEQGVGW